MRSHAATKLTGVFFWALWAASLFFCAPVTTRSQSTDQAYPTAVSENQLSGRIKARDIGDARLTAYYYAFNARQGDLFINVVTKNLNGSVNLFAADGLRPLAQILVYADLSASETGRVVYLRKPEKLILRIEGRTPNDDPAEFQIKFAGSFEAVAPTEEPEAPKVSNAALENDSGVRVNSVGTIVEVIPKPKPTPKAATETAKTAEKVETETTASTEAKPGETKPESENPKVEKTVTEEKSAEETKSSEEKPRAAIAKSTVGRTRRHTRPVPPLKKETETANKENVNNGQAKPPEEAKPTEEVKKEEPKKAAPPPARSKTRPKVVVTDNIPQPKPDPLASINLVILFKDGSKIERPMSEVLRFSVDRGVLTVVSKDGTTAKYSILDVTSVTIQ
jgi:hypothetical protein